jgi:hypothetical protein
MRLSIEEIASRWLTDRSILGTVDCVWSCELTAGDAGTPRAVGVSVTSLRTLPTAAVAIVIATIVAVIHANPIPLNPFIGVVWSTISDTGRRVRFSQEPVHLVADLEAGVVFCYGLHFGC